MERVRPSEFVAKYRDSLRDHAAVFLLNVEALDEDSWSLLNGYVHEGGGLVIGLGDRCRPRTTTARSPARSSPLSSTR